MTTIRETKSTQTQASTLQESANAILASRRQTATSRSLPGRRAGPKAAQTGEREKKRANRTETRQD